MTCGPGSAVTGGPDVAKAPDGFIPLKALTERPSSPVATLAEIRRIYFKTTRETIEYDFVHAIELLKSLQSEEDREKATVYMQGLAEMRKEWGPKEAKSRKGRSAK